MAVNIPNPRQVIYSKGGVTVTLEFPKALENELEAQYGLMSPFQKFWDNMLLTDMNQYTFFQTGTLRQSAITATVIGSGELVWPGPAARMLYHGIVMVDPVTGRAAYWSEDFGFWSRPGVRKVPDPTGRELVSHAGGITGARWAERAANDLMPRWEQSAQAWISGRT